MDWIWAQQDRHWNKNGGVSLKDDKGREPFETKVKMKNCKLRVGENKEKFWVNSNKRKQCYKECGFFVSDDEFRPGEKREKVFGW